MSLVARSGLLLAKLAALIAADAPYETPFFGLIGTDMSPSKGNALADFGVVAFNGIPDWTALTPGTPFLNDDGDAEVLCNLVALLTTSAPSVAKPVYGYVISNKAKDNWIFAERFAAPYVFVRTGQPFQMVPRIIESC